jgi:alpha-amylase
MAPVRFVFGLHLHQPVGNFDHVFQQHLDDVYAPLLERLTAGEFLPVVLHVSGPLLEWLDAHAPAWMDRLGRLAAEGRVELLLSGFYEPVLASLPRRDRLDQIGWMRDALRRRFGVEATGLWLTERVWQPELAADLAEAGVKYALVDDRHFVVCGFPQERLHKPYWTEADGKRLALFPIDERLRYLIPFRPPEETAEYLERLGAEGHQLAVLADDGEKFGGWPGTKDWVYHQGWLDRFIQTVRQLTERGIVRLSTLAHALADVPSGGVAYLPTASYREMEAWSLPPDAALRLARLEQDLGEARMAGPDGALVRGTHWSNFLAKYPEANRMHKKMQALSALCRSRQDPPDARRAIGRAQCNDAYWHGVFGGLYLPHLREAIWRNLAAAEAQLRERESLSWEVLDLDADGHDEIWVHSANCSVVVSPWRGGAIEELTRFSTGINYAGVLTRRLEAYHVTATSGSADAPSGEAGAPSIHDLEAALRLEERPPLDADDRAIGVDRVLAPDLAADAYARGGYAVVRSWARTPAHFQISQSHGIVEIRLRLHGADGSPLLKAIRIAGDGKIELVYQWTPEPDQGDALFAPELSLFRPLTLGYAPDPDVWTFPIETVAKSERGLDRTRQGESVTPRWAFHLGAARLELGPPPD